ncbi:hypothetical protein OC834_002396 [Tilletia horrida]|nr:hypothetical protein OC834_002396 [Tilletia horrida]
MTGPVFRECGVHERYSVMRTVYGSPPVVTFAAVLTATSADAEPVLQHLRSRVTHILANSLPMRCGIIQAESHRPRFCSLEPAPTARDVVFLRKSAAVEEGLDEEAALRKLRNEYMTAEQTLLMDKSQQSLYDGALWTVALYPVTSSRKPSYIVVASFNHILTDGKGTFNLFHALLSAAPPPPDNKDVFPPASDSAFDMQAVQKPDPRRDEETEATPFWPSEVRKNLLECPIGLRTIDLGPSFTPRLKAVATSHGVKTLHAILEVASVFALSLAVNHGSGDWNDGASPKFAIGHSTPINIRGSPLSTAPVSTHGHYAGNWVGGRGGKTLCRPQLQFWDQVKHVAAQLADPATLKGAMALWNGLKALPSSTGDKLEPAQHDAVDGQPLEVDGWSAYARHAVEQTPQISTFLASLGCSNLGFFPLDRTADDDLFTVSNCCWTQTASPIADAIIVNIMGAGWKLPTPAGAGSGAGQKEGEGLADGSVAAATVAAEHQPILSQAVADVGGLSFGITYRQGSVDEANLERFEAYLTRLLSLLAQGQIAESDDVAAIWSKLA